MVINNLLSFLSKRQLEEAGYRVMVFEQQGSRFFHDISCGYFLAKARAKQRQQCQVISMIISCNDHDRSIDKIWCWKHS